MCVNFREISPSASLREEHGWTTAGMGVEDWKTVVTCRNAFPGPGRRRSCPDAKSANWNLGDFPVPVNAALDQKHGISQPARPQTSGICDKIRYATPGNQPKPDTLSSFPDWPASLGRKPLTSQLILPVPPLLLLSLYKTPSCPESLGQSAPLLVRHWAPQPMDCSPLNKGHHTLHTELLHFCHLTHTRDYLGGSLAQTSLHTKSPYGQLLLNL